MQTIKTQQEQALRVCLFGYPVDITTKQQALDFTIERMQNKQGMHIVTINPEIITAADKAPELAQILKEAELVIPDSTGIMLALKSLGLIDTEKIPGIEFSESLMKLCEEKELKVAFLGGSKETINLLNAEILKNYPALNIVFSYHGFFSEEEMPQIQSELKKAEPNLLFVAMGAPKQEFFIKNSRKILDKTVMIGVGGSFDVWAKKVKRAPVIFRTLGIEWLHRLIKEPSRWSRMFPVLPLFFLRILFDRKKLHKIYTF